MSKSLKKLIDINRLREFKNKLVGTGSAYVQTGAVDQTIAGTKTFSNPIAGSVTGSSGSCTGNAATATKATGNANGKELTNTIIKGLSISGKTITYTQIDGTTGTLTTQDTNTDTLMTQNVSTTNSKYPILLCPTANATSNQGAKTGIFGANALINPSTGEIISKSNGTGAFRVVGGNYGFFIRNDGSNTYFLLTTSGDQYGSWTSARPLTISNSTGVCSINGNAATATTATTAEACTGNAATATKLATARTIALSGAATGTATGFDGSGNITIPVTALAASAIRAQWYAAYPDGAEAHNAMWGGRDITAAFDAGTVSANIANGSFKDIFPGDYITKRVTISGETYDVTWVVADCDYWINKGDGDTGMETHHVVIVPQAPIFNANMNDTNTTEGGYMGSRMFKETIPACATGIVNAFGASHILTFRDWLISGITANQISSGLPNFTGGAQWGASTWVSVQCDLMTEKMVLGAPVNSASALDEWCATRQFSAFRLSERLINYNRQAWWLRSIVSSARFALVSGYGDASAGTASNSLGVRPFALLK